MGHLLSPTQAPPPGEVITVVWGGARAQAERRLLGMTQERGTASTPGERKLQLCTETSPNTASSFGKHFLVLKGSEESTKPFSVFAGFSPRPWCAARCIWLQSLPRASKVFASSSALLNPQHAASARLLAHLAACL